MRLGAGMVLSIESAMAWAYLSYQRVCNTLIMGGSNGH
jgi:hypothetical protein